MANTQHKRRKLIKNGGTRSKSRSRRISSRNNTTTTDDLLTSKQIQKLMKGIERGEDRKYLKSKLQTLVVEIGYEDCYGNKPTTLLEQAQSRIHCYFTSGGW